MLANLFQDSDVILFMKSDREKRPYEGTLVRASAYRPYSGSPAYFSINPIDHKENRNTKGEGSARASINVSAFRNFLFEIDDMLLDDQLELLNFLHTKIPFATVTYSGSKSYHAIISISDTLPFKPHTETGIAQYSQAWRALSTELSLLASDFLGPGCPSRLFDPACKDPARLSRTPGAIRPDTKSAQVSITEFGGYLSSDQVLHLMRKHNFESVSSPASRVPQSDEMPVELFKMRLLYPENLGLASKLRNVNDWASDSNMYPALFQLTLWIIDSLGAPLPTTMQYMHENIFPILRAAGYPRNPEIAVYNAYSWKGLA